VPELQPRRVEALPDSKLYRSISEVSDLVDVKPHVLRYWETQFSMLRPKKNRAGNRMYRPEEVKLLLRIKELLYDRRFTIAGARRRLLDERREAAPQVELGFADAEKKLLIHEVKNELRQLLGKLRERPVARMRAES
jgi:DNA-binding transcriptional MerR regulator